jgi:hypothetical protein
MQRRQRPRWNRQMITKNGIRHGQLHHELVDEKDSLAAWAQAEGTKGGPLAMNLAADQITWLEKLIAQLGLGASGDPVQIVRKCVGGMDEARTRDFVLTNLLEAAKRGENPTNAARRFEQMGLLPPNTAPTDPDGDAEPAAALFSGPMRWLMRLKDGLVTVGRKLAKIGMNALLALADMTKIKLKPNVQLAPIPSLGLTVDVDFDAEISGKEIFEIFEPIFSELPNTT